MGAQLYTIHSWISRYIHGYFLRIYPGLPKYELKNIKKNTNPILKKGKATNKADNTS